MKTLFACAILLFSGTALAQTSSQSNIARMAPDFTQQTQRACLFPANAWAVVDCSNSAAASSAQLNAWSRYIIQCGDDTYLRFGTAATGQDASSSTDGWIPSGAWVEFLTTDSTRYVSVKNKNSDSDCRILECR